MTHGYGLVVRIKGWWVLTRAAVDYLFRPVEVEDALYRALCLRITAKGRHPWQGR